MQNAIPKEIFEYDDYVDLLAELIRRRKEKGLTFSFRWFALKAGFNSPNYLHLVLNRKRHLSEESAIKAAEIFQLSGASRDYFVTLVKFNKAKTASQRAAFGEVLLKIRLQDSVAYLDKAKMGYYLSWQNIALRECLVILHVAKFLK